MRFALASCVVALAATAAAAPAAAQGDMVKVDLPEPKGMYYTVFVPKGVAPGRTYPLVLALHGNGHKSDNHIGNMAKVSCAELPVFVVAPQYQNGNTFNDPTYPECGKRFREIIEAVSTKYPVDRGRLFVEGFSMGAVYGAGFTYRWWETEKDTFSIKGLWLNGTAVPPDKDAPPIPILLMVGEKETAVLGKINVTKDVRETYREMAARGLDVRYQEIPNIGHTVNEVCLQHMRDALAAYPTFEGVLDTRKKLDAAFEPIAAALARQQFTGALDALAKLGADDSSLTATLRTTAKTLAKGCEDWLEKFAGREAKRMEAAFDGSAWLLFERLAEQVKDRADLAKAFASASAKLGKSRMGKAELDARQQFRDALKKQGEDAAAGTALFQKLAAGPYKVTHYGKRAAEHLQGWSEEYSK